MSRLLDQFRALAARRPFLAAALGLALALALGNYFLWQRRQSAALEHTAARERGERILSSLINRDQIGADVTRLRNALAVIDQNLVVETDMEINLGVFYKLERQTRIRLVQLSQLSSPPSPEGNPFRAIPISLRATGTYPQLMNYIRELETGPRILAIRTFSLGTTDAKSGAMSLDLTLDLLGK